MILRNFPYVGMIYKIRMSSISLQDILKSVDILSDPTLLGYEKSTASSFLSQLSETSDYCNIAMEILLSEDSCNCLFHHLLL